MLENGPIIGEGTKIHPSAVICPWVVIGKNCRIHAGAIIGGEGLTIGGRQKTGLRRKPAKARVIIHDNSEVGPNSVVQRGSTRDTIVGENTFIGPLCNIGHDVQIGKHVIITGKTNIAGFCIVHDGVLIGTGACIKNRIVIGKDSFVGIGSLVLHNVPPNTVVYGRPAKPRPRQPERYRDRGK